MHSRRSLAPARRIRKADGCGLVIDRPDGRRGERFFSAASHRTAVLVKQGAEAELRTTEFLGRPAIEKYRRAKAYRLDVLDDELRRSRIRHETRLMAEARAAGVAVPILYDINLVENKIIMEFVDGPTAKHVLDRGVPLAGEVAGAMC